MKKLSLFFLIAFLVSGNMIMAQRGILKRVAKSVTNDLIGKIDGNEDDIQPEPTCACDQPELLMSLGGKWQLNYLELGVSILDDGRILAVDTRFDRYYIVEAGVTQGPYKPGDPRIAVFITPDEDDGSVESFIKKNKPYISRDGDKLVINFDGKTYGPYARIDKFLITKSKEKFAAIVMENELFTEEFGESMEAANKNAKTQEEKMKVSMQFAQELMKNRPGSGEPLGTVPELVTNIPGVDFDLQMAAGSELNNTLKYDEILMVAYDKIKDIHGNVLFTINPENVDTGDPMFLNSTNTRYATYRYGTLTFNDHTTMDSMFNTHLIKENGKVYLAYMYYSPKSNAIMQCRIPF